MKLMILEKIRVIRTCSSRPSTASVSGLSWVGNFYRFLQVFSTNTLLSMNETSHSHTTSYVGIGRAQSVAIFYKGILHFCCYCTRYHKYARVGTYHKQTPA